MGVSESAVGDVAVGVASMILCAQGTLQSYLQNRTLAQEEAGCHTTQ